MANELTPERRAAIRARCETPVGIPLDAIVSEILSEPGEAATAYLRTLWLGDVLDALVSVRRSAGFTQAEVAERMGTKQSAIARMEHDLDGGYSARRLIDYAIACGYLPEVVRMRPIEDCRQEALHLTLKRSDLVALDAAEARLALAGEREGES